ncbi:MAG: PBP1A family penicillin-binding protein, partial [Pseudomonadota bacterium]
MASNDGKNAGNSRASTRKPKAKAASVGSQSRAPAPKNATPSSQKPHKLTAEDPASARGSLKTSQGGSGKKDAALNPIWAMVGYTAREVSASFTRAASGLLGRVATAGKKKRTRTNSAKDKASRTSATQRPGDRNAKRPKGQRAKASSGNTPTKPSVATTSRGQDRPRKYRQVQEVDQQVAPATTTNRQPQKAPPQTANKKAHPKKAKKSHSLRPRLRDNAWMVALGTSVSTAFVVGIVGLYVAFIEIAPEPPASADLWAVKKLPSVVLQDGAGNELASRGAKYGEAVAIESLPSYFVDAILSTEDRRFYDHYGIDFRGIARAAFANLQAGGITEGGSTITQQLAKNLFLSPKQTYRRKAQEAMLALWIEGHYEKDEILSLYLNRIYMGAGAYGVASAAETYFEKSITDVTLAEAAMLAGLPKAPSKLSPISNPFGAQDRAKEVLNNLADTTTIDADLLIEAKASPARVVADNTTVELGYFFDMAAERARDLASDGQKDLVIRTTIDTRLQKLAQKALSSMLTTEAKLAGADQGAIVVFDNATGAMVAMVGGRSYEESQFNRATQARRQPGSAFKPFVYATAYENGFTPDSRFVDQPINIAGWTPSNYNNRYSGPMRLTEAIAQSVNTVAVQVSENVGRQKVIEMAQRLGFASNIPTEEAGIALGAFDATLEELTAAYMPFARRGMATKPHSILSVSDKDGNIVYDHNPGPPRQALSPQVAKQITHSLYQVLANGTGMRARLGNRDAVGKTGTTNDWRDAWFVGYTAQYTAGVWVGNDGYLPMNRITGGTLPAVIWQDF